LGHTQPELDGVAIGDSQARADKDATALAHHAGSDDWLAYHNVI